MDSLQGLSPSFILSTFTQKFVYLTDTPQTPDVQHRELCSKFCKTSRAKQSKKEQICCV